MSFRGQETLEKCTQFLQAKLLLLFLYQMISPQQQYAFDEIHLLINNNCVSYKKAFENIFWLRIKHNHQFTFSQLNCCQVIASRQSSKVSKQNEMNVINTFVIRGKSFQAIAFHHIGKNQILSISSIYKLGIHYIMIRQRIQFFQNQ